MLEKQEYPDLRLFPGGPPKPPYDVAGHTLGYMLGVNVQAVAKPFEAPLARVTELKPAQTPLPAAPKWAYVFGPESNAGFIAAARLQKAGVPLFRTAAVSLGSVGGRRSSRRARGSCPRRRRRAACSKVLLANRIRSIRRERTDRGGRVTTEAWDAHRPVARRQQHAGRLDAVDVRAVRLQSPDRVVARLQGRSRGEIRHDRAARWHQPRDDCQRPRCQRGTTRPGNGPTASATRAGRSSRSGCATAARWSRRAIPSKLRVCCSICRSRRFCRKRVRAASWRSGARGAAKARRRRT